MEFHNSTICYQATQRVYRNAVVRHIRQIFTDKFPDNWKKQLKHAVGAEEWEKNQSNTRQRQISGESGSSVSDDFDVLDVAHFYNIFDIHFDLLFPSRTSDTQKDRNRWKRSVLDWVLTVKTLRDPMSHPPEQDFSFNDSFRMIDCEGRVLDALGLPEAAELKEIQKELSGYPKDAPEPVEPLPHSLPPREAVVVDFVGRTQELRKLWDWLRDPHAHRWAVAGEGGKGKSAIAYEFAAQVRFAAPEEILAVWWLSAKKKRFTERRAVSVSGPDFEDLRTACQKLLADYGWNEPIPSDKEELQSKVLRMFNEIPSLVVVDDLDSLEGQDEEAIEFFTLAAPVTKSKILLTTRRTVFGMAHTTTHVSGMSPEDFSKFVKSRCQIFGLDPKVLTPDRINEVRQLTEGSPLFAEDLLRLSASVSLAEAVKGWKGKEGDEARRYALGRELDMLSAEAKEALLAACLSSGPVSFAELESLTGFSKARLNAVISEMQRLFLVLKPRIIEGEERFDVNVNTRTLVVRVFDGTELYRRTQNAVDAVAGRLPYADRGRTGSVIRQAVFLVKTGEFSKAEETVQAALKVEPNNPSLIGALGYVYKSWVPQRATDARQQFARAAQLKCKRLDPYRQWIQLEIGGKEWTNAARAAAQGLKNLPGNVELMYWAGYAHSRLGKELLGGLLLERARTELETASDLLRDALRPPESLKASQERQLNSMCYRAIVITYDSLAELAELEHFRGLGQRDPLKGQGEYISRVKQFLTDWISEHPDDAFAERERSWYERKYGFEVGK
jgi:hypothetical protein